MSYPRNAATPKAVTVGALVKVADGTLLAATAGVAVRVDLDGGGWGAGGGTIAVDATSSTFTYAPIQAETNGDVLKVALYIAGYISISANVIMDPLDLAVNVTKISGSANAAARLALSAAQLIPGTVDTGSFEATTTQFEADDITEATADHYNGRNILWASGALAGQMTDIKAYALAGSNGHFTVTAMTEAPANNDTFIIV